MIRDQSFRIETGQNTQRLDAFVVRRAPTTSRLLVIRAIDSGNILVNGRHSKKGRKLEEGDEVRIVELLEASDWKAMPNSAVEIPVIHEDSNFIVINKPAGMPVHPLDPTETNTVVNGLLAAYPELAAIGPDPLFPSIVHRLDAETSGVMLAARDRKTYDYFRRQFREKRVNKKYTSLVCGMICEGGHLEHRLIHSVSGSHRMLVLEESEPKAMIAITEYSVQENFPCHTLLDVIIRTGVTHQIRCQFAHVGHPLAGDSLYGSKEADAEYKGRLFLHATEISFPDPVTGTERIFTADLPDDLRRALARLQGKDIAS